MKFFFFLFFSFSFLFAEVQLHLAPLAGIPLGALAQDFELGPGGEVELRGSTGVSFLKPLEKRNFNFSSGFAFMALPMKKTAASKFNLYQLWLGLGYRYPLASSLYLLPALGGGVYYANYFMAARNQNLNIVNPLFFVSTTLQYVFIREVALDLTSRYHVEYMGEPTVMSQIAFSLGVSVKMIGKNLSASPTSHLQESIVMHYEEGSYSQAEREIDALEKIAPSDLLIDKYRSLIFQQKRYRQAHEQQSALRTLRAIALLRQAPDIPEAVEMLTSLREQYQPQIKPLLDAGVAAYERSDFDACIANMEQVLLIDPAQSEASIYLPRAINRRRALQKLK